MVNEIAPIDVGLVGLFGTTGPISLLDGFDLVDVGPLDLLFDLDLIDVDLVETFGWLGGLFDLFDPFEIFDPADPIGV